jgi:hypothetical protein
MRGTLFIVNLVIAVLPVTFLSAQDLVGYQKLRGAVISTAPDNDYTRHAYNAFDTNEGTSFMARDANGWVGIDLGGSYAIRKVRVYPMPDRNQQFVGARFQGADNSDFDSPVTLFTVTQAPNAGQYVTYDMHGSRTFRYVRCINPDHRLSVAELEFYADENAQALNYPQLTNLPTVYLETDGQFDFVNKETYVASRVAVRDGDSLGIFPAQVRGRGNSTWEFMEKKPFRIKFDSKQHFLGLSANAKSWTLLSNAVDKTMLRNGLAFEVSRKLGYEFTPACKMVDVVLDGFYYGAYMASDHVEINENRINIDEMKAGDITEPKITGGYHLEIDAYAEQEPVHFFTPRQLPFTIKSPENDVLVQYQWIENHIVTTENTLMSDPELALQDYIDLPSAVRHYIHSELTGNCDSYWCIPCYKKRGDSRLYFGPVWDFDQAFYTNARVPLYTETLSTGHGTAQAWFRKILQQPEVQTLARQMWRQLKADSLERYLVDFLEENAENLQQSQALNYERWNSLNRKVWFEDEDKLFGTYREYIDFVKRYINQRFAWFDERMAERREILAPSTPSNTPHSWRYRFNTPHEDWFSTSYDDDNWSQGDAPFGREQNLQNTDWTTNQIFIRTKFYVDADDLDSLAKASFYVWHDEDVEIYLNGQPALSREGYLTEYKYFDFDETLLQAGWNTLAAKCTQTTGGQLIDIGVYVTLEEQSDGPITSVLPPSAAKQPFSHYVSNGSLTINGLPAGETIRLYSIDGKLLKQQKTTGELRMALPARGIYIVHLQGHNIKIAY